MTIQLHSQKYLCRGTLETAFGVIEAQKGGGLVAMICFQNAIQSSLLERPSYQSLWASDEIKRAKRALAAAARRLQLVKE